MTSLRWTSIVVALGLLAISCTAAEEEPTSTLPVTLPSLDPTTTTAPAETTTTAAELALWGAGTCVDLGANAADDLPYAPYGEELVVDCGAPHTHELFLSEIVAEGADDPYPADLNDRLWAGCFQAFADLFGYPSVESTLDLVLYLPDEEEWAAGERYHGCVLYQRGTQQVYRPLIGMASDDAEDYRWVVEPGTCYAELDLTILALADPASCDELHTLEFIGEAPLTPPGGVYPGIEATAQLSSEACQALLADYAAQDIEDLPLVAFPLPTLITEGEWDAGATSVKCYAFAGSAERGLLLVTGSLGEGTLEVLDPEEGVSA